MADSTSRPTRVRYIVLLGLCLAAGLAYIHRLALGQAQTTIRAETGISENGIARAISLFFLTYALFQIPTGILVDRWGARRSLFLFGMFGAITVALSAGTLVAGATAGLAVLLVSRALMGIAQAGLFPASARCIANWFPLDQRAFASGTLQACMSLGLVIGSYILGELLPVVPWPWVFLMIAVPGVIWSLWFFWWFRDRPRDHPSVNEAEALLIAPQSNSHVESHTVGPIRWYELALHPKILCLCWGQFFRAGANVFWMSWCPGYLEEAYNLDKPTTGQLMIFPFLGVVLGSLAGGYLTDRILTATGSKRWSRQGAVIGTSVVGIAFFIVAYLVPLQVYAAVAMLFLAAFFTSGGNSCAYAVSIDIGGRHMAVVFGSMNMMGNFGATAFPLVAPLWMHAFNKPAILLLLALMYFVGMIFWIFLNPNGTIEKPAQATIAD